jgi:inositol transporter-like SP family MFS transporter
MLRATAQGSIYAVSRFATAALNAVTPALLALNPGALYVGVSALAAVGFVIGWWGFRQNVRTQFDLETRLVPEAAESSSPSERTSA